MDIRELSQPCDCGGQLRHNVHIYLYDNHIHVKGTCEACKLEVHFRWNLYTLMINAAPDDGMVH